MQKLLASSLALVDTPPALSVSACVAARRIYDIGHRHGVDNLVIPSSALRRRAPSVWVSLVPNESGWGPTDLACDELLYFCRDKSRE